MMVKTPLQALAVTFLPFFTRSAFSSGVEYFGPLGGSPCPESCEVAGNDPKNWTRYHDADLLLACTERPKLLDFTVRTPLNNPKAQHVIRACTTFRGEIVEQQATEATYNPTGGESPLTMQATVDFKMAWSITTEHVIPPQVVTAAKEIQGVLMNETSNEYTSSLILFAHYGNSAVGAYVGGRIHNRGAALTVVQQFIDYVQDPKLGISRTFLIQSCGKDLDADYVFGIIGDTTPGVSALSTVQDAVISWSKAECVTGLEGASTFGNSIVWLTNTIVPPGPFFLTANTTTISNSTFMTRETNSDHPLTRRAICRTIQVVSGDGCASLAKKCGIKSNEITKYNPGKNFCGTLKIGQHVCCSSGSLPDFRPKPNPDGSCASYVVRKGDWCDKIASEKSLTVKDIESFNKKTWGWSGCNLLHAGIRLCLSKGDPPMPEPIPNAVCGPQKPGTKKPPKGTDLTTLNPCPLNVCCNVWGQCGITEDFCIKSSLGPPGTSKPGKNGCISHCGMDIVNNGSPPKETISIGYFEAWNWERFCLNMDVTNVKDSVTHIHFAFGEVSKDFQPSIGRMQDQFDLFRGLKNKKRILAFGGWAASTGPSSYWIFREGVKPENREKLATNLANFIKKHDLDGLDMDWEYPGAPDIPGVPPAKPIDGPNYLELLKLLKKKLGKKSLSIAAPASFWYLKSFPIQNISKVVDYIVYMTYDLHGQWDYGNAYSSPGCPEGNCLRSHINITETHSALSMITKAGVPANKIVVGVSSYGRSFRMTKAGCTGPMCRFVGPESAAAKGRCTDTAGYISNAEIAEIIKYNPRAKTFKDNGSSSNILVYDDIQWVAYMDDDNKKSRNSRWKDLNFRGVTDWAIDLEDFMPYDPPSNRPHPPDLKKKWNEITCDSPGMNDTEIDPRLRWEWSKANDAWNEVIKKWKHDGDDSRLSFPRYVSNFFHGPEKLDCDAMIDANPCDTTMRCLDDHQQPPAGTHILNSFVSVHNSYKNLHGSIESAKTSVRDTLEVFAADFAPDKPDIWAQLLIDFVSFSIGAVGGPFLNNFLKNSMKHSMDSLKDNAFNMIAFGTNLSKDLVASGKIAKKASETLSVVLKSLVDNWTFILEEMLKKAFGGEDDGIKLLYNLITHGKVLLGADKDARATKKELERMLYSLLIPPAWAFKEVYPVIIDSGEGCEVIGLGNYKWVSPKDAEKTRYCVDGKQYYLLSAQGTQQDCPHPEHPCQLHSLVPPPGLDKLGQWGELSLGDMVKGSLNTFKALRGNRKKNGYPEVNDEKFFDEMFIQLNHTDQAHMAPGVMNIPVCGPDEVMDNWYKKTVLKDPHIDWLAYPCNEA